MSAIEIIEQIKVLPLDEQAKIKAFARDLPCSEETDGTAIMDTEKARQISRRIFAENHELFTKLAR